ncbi:MAG: histone deacetylase family protein [Bacteroidetes bacterium]|nr:histone deacetylase family protein [Bacteroidota bacterium]MBL6943019.1 histone deacetylase family protein [Bacteroidales bacterium]
MKIIFNSKFLMHNQQNWAAGSYLLEHFPKKYGNTDVNGESYITLVHTEEHKKSIYNACINGDTVAESLLSPDSYEAAISAVGLTIMASEQGDFAVVRPPGHHADRERAAGLCLFNNIAIATQKLVNEGKKVFIFDFDGHHGDGTQSIFYNSNRVFFCSVHQLFAYPFSGFANEKGSGKGTGFTLNLPLMAGSGDKEFLDALHIAITAAMRFNPDVVGVSAGFDGYEKDSLLLLKYTKKAYYECGLRLRRTFPIVFGVLEGGYHNELLECVEAFVEGVNVGARPRKTMFDSDMSLG